MPNYQGQLNSNEVLASMWNMIINIRTFADNIYATKATLADLSRVEGGMYGDTKLYISTDILKSIDWTADAEAQNLLMLHRPPEPKTQPVTINVFKMIPVTVDYYLSKRAWGSPEAFSQFNNIVLAWLTDTKRVYDSTTFNTFIGTNVSKNPETSQNIVITLPKEPENPSESDLEAYNRICAQTIATKLADIMVDIEDVTRLYNDNQFLRSFKIDDMRFVWNSKWVNQIRKLDMPTIFHKDSLMDKFAEHTLPPRYFGNININAGTSGGSNVTVRALKEKDFGTKHVFAGDLIPDNTAYESNETYGEDPSIVLKIYHKDSVPFMTGFETGSEFYNPRSLTETHYLIWGHNTLVHLANYPFITIKAVAAE